MKVKRMINLDPSLRVIKNGVDETDNWINDNQ